MEKILTLLVIILFLSCNEGLEIDAAAVEKEIEKNWSSFEESWEAEDAEACAQFYTENAVNIPPASSPKQGRQEIQDFYQFLFDGNIKSDYKVETESLEVFANSAVEVGNFQVEWTRNDSTEWTYKARNMTFWKKEENGEWKIDKFLFNNPPADK